MFSKFKLYPVSSHLYITLHLSSSPNDTNLEMIMNKEKYTKSKKKYLKF